MTFYKTYNLKLSKKNHFKLKSIENKIEIETENKTNRNEAINKIIDCFDIDNPPKKLFSKE